jgi:hypothetical protein
MDRRLGDRDLPKFELFPVIDVENNNTTLWRGNFMTEGSEAGAGPDLQTVPVVVVVEGVSAGFAVRERGGLRFRAIHPRFQILDGSRFARAEHLSRAAGRVARASRD